MPRRTNPRELLVAESESMRQVAVSVERAAGHDDPVLILGEPGSGRELVARIIHLASRRRSRELVTVRAGAAPKAIFVDEIEGTSDSAFHRAHRSSLLVKDVCDLTRAGQRKLSRILRERRPGGEGGAEAAAPVAAPRPLPPLTGAANGTMPEQSLPVPKFDVRVLATCDPGLDRAAEAEVFNRVLFERLSTCLIEMPPLRDRAPDIAPLATQLIRQYAREIGRSKLTISTRAYDRLIAYPWPGNVAELKGIARRLVVNVRGSHIEAGDVDATLPLLAERVPLEQMSLEEMVRCKLSAFLRRFEGYPVAGVHEDVLARVERPLLDLVMEHTGGNQVKAAEILGLNRNTLRRKLTEHGLTGARGGRGTHPVHTSDRDPSHPAREQSRNLKKSRGAL
jgi:two-component system, NtrC family, nitrogen regulation response regulator GlnG